LARDVRQKQAFAPRAAMHKYAAWRLLVGGGRVDQRRDELLITRADPPFCIVTAPSAGSVRGAQNGIFCRVAIFWRIRVEVRGQAK
jgi:hypothetical protein